jgi:hypothetical protein
LAALALMAALVTRFALPNDRRVAAASSKLAETRRKRISRKTRSSAGDSGTVPT